MSGLESTTSSSVNSFHTGFTEHCSQQKTSHSSTCTPRKTLTHQLSSSSSLPVFPPTLHPPSTVPLSGSPQLRSPRSLTRKGITRSFSGLTERRGGVRSAANSPGASPTARAGYKRDRVGCAAVPGLPGLHQLAASANSLSMDNLSTDVHSGWLSLPVSPVPARSPARSPGPPAPPQTSSSASVCRPPALKCSRSDSCIPGALSDEAEEKFVKMNSTRSANQLAVDGYSPEMNKQDDDDCEENKMTRILQNITQAHIYQKRMKRLAGTGTGSTQVEPLEVTVVSTPATPTVHTPTSAAGFKKFLRDRYLSTSSQEAVEDPGPPATSPLPPPPLVAPVPQQIWSPIQQKTLHFTAGGSGGAFRPVIPAQQIRGDSFRQFRDHRGSEAEDLSPRWSSPSDIPAGYLLHAQPHIPHTGEDPVSTATAATAYAQLQSLSRMCRLESSTSCSSYMSTDLESLGDPFSPMSPRPVFSPSSGYLSPQSPRSLWPPGSGGSRRTSYGLSPLALTPLPLRSAAAAAAASHQPIPSPASNHSSSSNSTSTMVHTHTGQQLVIVPPTPVSAVAAAHRLTHSAPQTPQSTPRLPPYFVFPPPGQSAQQHSVPGVQEVDSSMLCCPVCRLHCGSYEELVKHAVIHAQVDDSGDFVLSASISQPASPASSILNRKSTNAGSTDGSTSSSPAEERPHLCQVCSRSFTRSDMLSRHMRLHTGLKPYECLTCGQAFSRSDHLNTHMRTHTGEKPYRCPLCPYSACRRDMITRHLKIHRKRVKSPSPLVGSPIPLFDATSSSVSIDSTLVTSTTSDYVEDEEDNMSMSSVRTSDLSADENLDCG